MTARVVTLGIMSPSAYTNLHAWVRKELGTPSECENCETTDASRFEWANISGEYRKSIDDWARLCCLCHRLIDNQRKNVCKRGHLLEGDNLRYKKMHKSWGRYCRKCAAIHFKEWNKKKDTSK